MRKIIVIVLLFVAVAVFGDDFTFRGLPWGSSVEDIIAKEGKPDSNTGSQLIYQNKNVAGYNNVALLFYCSPPRSDTYSEKIGLRTAKYMLGVTKANSEYVYNDLLDKLSALYGTPTLGTKPYYNISDRYNYWIVSKTKISIKLLIDLKIGDSQGTFVFIDYESPDWIGNEFNDL
jgi:hypothetical protein